MPSPTVEQVRVIIDTCASDAQVQSFISDAEVLLEDCIKGFTEARTLSIVRWVTAHLLATAGLDNGPATVTSKKLGDASETYSRQPVDKGLAGTSYGQAAMALDKSGCLANLHKQTAGFTVL